MKIIKMVKFYAGVLHDGATLTSFTPDEGLSDKTLSKGLTATVVANGVEVSNPKMTCMVPWNNIQYIQYVEGSKSTEPAKAPKTK